MTDSARTFLLGVLTDGDPDTLLAGVRDWSEIVSRAEREALTPLLWRWLRRAGIEERVPTAACMQLRRQAIALTAQALRLEWTLASILQALDEAGVRTAPLRGVAVAERLYGDAALRPSGDLDLLVDRAEVARLLQALAPLGFHEFDRRPGFAREFSYALELVEPRSGVVVEPHFALGYPPYVDAVDLARVWSRAGVTRVAGVPTLSLAPEAVLLNLCLHIVHKAPVVPLLWLYDIDRLLRRDGAALDWSELVALARQSRVAPLVAATLRQAAQTFDSPVCEPALAELQQGATAPLLRLLSGSLDGRESLATLLALPGARARLRYAAAVLFPSAEFMVLQYGLTRRHQLGPAYVRRAGSFTWQGLKGVARLLS